MTPQSITIWLHLIICMEVNGVCSECNHRKPVDPCIICDKILCPECYTRHKDTKQRFVSFKRIAAGNEENLEAETNWVVNWSGCIKNLEQEIQQHIQRCREEIVAAYDTIYKKLGEDRTEKLGSLDEIEKALNAKIQEANNPYKQPHGKIAKAIYVRCLRGSTDAPRIFKYHVTVTEAFLNDCLETEFGTNVPELAKFNRSDTGVLGKELEQLKEEMELQRANGEEREQQLKEEYRQLQERYHLEATKCEELQAQVRELEDRNQELQDAIYSQVPSSAQSQRNRLEHSMSMKHVSPLVFPPLPSTPRNAMYHPDFFPPPSPSANSGHMHHFSGAFMHKPGARVPGGRNLPDIPGAAQYYPEEMQYPAARQGHGQATSSNKRRT